MPCWCPPRADAAASPQASNARDPWSLRHTLATAMGRMLPLACATITGMACSRPRTCDMTVWTLTDRQYSFRRIKLIQIRWKGAREVINGWTSHVRVAPLGFDLGSHFRRWRSQTIAKQLIPRRSDSTFFGRLKDSFGILLLYQARCLWAPWGCGRPFSLGHWEVSDQWIKEFRPVATVQDLYTLLDKLRPGIGRKLSLIHI
eukprot:1655237-Amphidinium_carterae.1